MYPSALPPLAGELSFAARKEYQFGTPAGTSTSVAVRFTEFKVGAGMAARPLGLGAGGTGSEGAIKAIDRSGSVCGISLDDWPSPMGTIGTTSELQDHGAINQTVEERGR